jgi:hypothetical protein
MTEDTQSTTATSDGALGTALAEEGERVRAEASRAEQARSTVLGVLIAAVCLTVIGVVVAAVALPDASARGEETTGSSFGHFVGLAMTGVGALMLAVAAVAYGVYFGIRMASDD